MQRGSAVRVRRVTPGRGTTRPPGGRLRLLNSTGQHRLEAAFVRRARARSSFADFADGYLQALKDDGTLAPYLLAGLDPFAALGYAADHGVR